MKEKNERGGRISPFPRSPTSQDFPGIRITANQRIFWKQNCFAMDEGLLIGFLTSAFPNSFSVI